MSYVVCSLSYTTYRILHTEYLVSRPGANIPIRNARTSRVHKRGAGTAVSSGMTRSRAARKNGQRTILWTGEGAHPAADFDDGVFTRITESVAAHGRRYGTTRRRRAIGLTREIEVHIAHRLAAA